MKISVIVVTVRMGGVDLLYHGLNNQTFPQEDFEVLIVDSCYQERKQYLRPLPSNWYHLDLPDVIPYYDASYANNYGLALACGDLVVFLTDNIWPEPHFLERHWQIYSNFPGYSMCGYCDRYELPPLASELTWQNAAWSIYEYEFDKNYAELFFGLNKPYLCERKGGAKGPQVPNSPYFELSGDLFYAALNESIPMSVLREINGWNLDLDGAYGVADIELGMRANLAGHKFLTYPHSINNKLGQRTNSAKIPGKFKPNIRTVDEQRALVYKIIDDIQSQRTPVKIPHGAWSR